MTCVQDSKFPRDTGINPLLADVKEQKNTRNYRLTLTIPAHTLAVSRLLAHCPQFFSFSIIVSLHAYICFM